MKLWHMFALAFLPFVLLMGGVIWSSVRTNGSSALRAPATPTAAVVQAETPQPSPGGGGGGAANITIVAKNISFDQTSLKVKAGQAVNITFDNQDSGIPHNIHFAQDQSFSQTIDNAKTDVASGPTRQTLTFTAPGAGTYFFRCDVHPQQMNGTLTVE